MLETAKVPPAFETVKDNDEVIYWSGKPEFIPFILRGVPFLVVGLLAEFFLQGRYIQGAPRFFDMGTLFFLASALYMVYLFLVYGNTAYAISSKRLMMRSGFFGIDFKAVDYDKISDIEVNVNPIENLFGVGTIQAFSGRNTEKGARIYDRFISIANPYEVFKQIKEVAVDVKTDWNYPNALRPEENPGYRTKYNPKKGDAVSNV